MNKLIERCVFGAISLLLALSLAACGKPAEEPAAASPREVETVVVTPEAFVQVAELPGRIEPVRVAEVRARVAGIVLSRNFEEGADVKAGDLLFQIDPAPFKAALSRAQGELAKADAALFQAHATVKRYAPLVKIEAVSQQDYDAAQAAWQSAQAAKVSAQADVETARLNLGYASVKAPISGRIGRAAVTEGALVGQGETTLMARIQQLDPIYADFTQPVADALRMRAALAADKAKGANENALSLRVEGTDHQARGTLLFTDIAVDRSTGQVSLRGRFPNPDGVLLPGMYVYVAIPQAKDDAAILIPQRAVQRDANGQAQVLLIGQNGQVEPRPVQTGVMHGARWQITAGLIAGEQVIVGAMAGLNPGDAVQAKPLQPQLTHASKAAF